MLGGTGTRLSLGRAGDGGPGPLCWDLTQSGRGMELPREENEKNKSHTMGEGGARATQAPLALAQSGSPSLYGTQQCPRSPALGPRSSRSAGRGWRGGPARLWLWGAWHAAPSRKKEYFGPVTPCAPETQSTSLVIWAREVLRPPGAHPARPPDVPGQAPPQQHPGHTLWTLARPLPGRTVPREG